MLTNVDKSIFLDSNTIEILPVVSAEWNQNLFNAPYITVAGTGTKYSVTKSAGATATNATGDDIKTGFTTKKFTMSGGTGYVSYSVSVNGTASAYKVVIYVKTDSPIPVMLSAFGKGSNTQYGSSYDDVNSFGWTKLETYVGGSSSADAISNLTFTISANSYSTDVVNPVVFYTEPEVYETSFFDYQYNSLWPTESVFSYFRPGESYVSTGNIKSSFPADYRKVNTSVIDGYSTATYSPISPIVKNPSFSFAAHPVPIIKNALPSEMSAYKYFVSDTTNKSITAIYEQNITSNKIIVKLNTLMTTPTVNLIIDGSTITVDGSTSITPDSNGVIAIYWTGSAWTKTKWSIMPKFTNSGTVSTYTSFKKITVTQTAATRKTEFASYTSQDVIDDLSRMHLIEISPRLEIDLSDFVKDVSINKSLDSKNNFVPISSINSDDATITLSSIPVSVDNSFVPIFSSQSNLSINILTNMLRKNIKFYVNFNVKSYFQSLTNSFVQLSSGAGTYVPGGIFYSDSWNETDIKDVNIQCFDVTRYLQTTPVPDYVANLKSVFDIITNILDLAGYSDYDYDSLYSVCHDSIMPLDMSYFYCNSKDTTIIDALGQIFLAYQIGAYIDEYGIMKFKSLSNVLGTNYDALPSNQKITVNDSHIVEGGYSISNKAKPGKISLRYQSPKIKQSLSLQNANNADIKNSPSFVYTTSNDVMWSQQNLDSVGFNHLSSVDSDSNSTQMLEKDNKFCLNVNDTLDIFHTYSLNNNGYAFIEDELVSFVYKQYKIHNNSNSTTVSVKNDLELASEINRFTKKYQAGLTTSTGSTPSDYDVVVTPTGYITDVQRGLFGTVPSDHLIISSLTSKSLSEAELSSSVAITTGTSNTSIIDTKSINENNPSVKHIAVSSPVGKKAIVYPTSKRENDYSTYSTKFSFAEANTCGAGLFFNMSSTSSAGSPYFVELIKSNQKDLTISATGTKGQNTLTVDTIDGLATGERISGAGIPQGTLIISVSATTVQSDGSLADIPTIAISNAITADISGSLKVENNRYIIAIYQNVSGSDVLISWTNATGIVDSIINNFEKIFVKNDDSGNYFYTTSYDQVFQLKVVHYNSNGEDGEDSGEIISVFLNNVEVNGWQVAGTSSETVDVPWVSTGVNEKTHRRKKITLPSDITNKSIFGFYATTTPVDIPGITYNEISSKVVSAYLREIYATQKPLKERSTNYWYQTREFLNGMIEKQNIFSKSPSYMMQTTPEVLGINFYDVQYTTPAAVVADIHPIEYTWFYFPGTTPQEQQTYMRQLVDEYSLSYSTPLNTGFRAKMAIANNSSHMVYLSKQSDQLNNFAVNLNLYTHEIIAPSDPEIIEHVTDRSNITEVAQIDSEWIQSKEAANKMLSVIAKGFDGFSRDTTLQIFGNPLIQVGDILTVTYTLAGINQQKYLVHSVSQTFNQGLKTNLVLNSIGKGVSY